MRYEFGEIFNRVNLAIDILFKNDVILLEKAVNERTISHKLAEYLQTQFPEWHVDCEYNRKDNDIKRLNGIEECNEQRKSDRIYPDIIVHHRGIEDNLLVIEIKTDNQDDPCDRKKLELLTKKEGEYGYDMGVYIQFNRLNAPKLTWYRDGKTYG